MERMPALSWTQLGANTSTFEAVKSEMGGEEHFCTNIYDTGISLCALKKKKKDKKEFRFFAFFFIANLRHGALWGGGGG